MTAKIKVLQGDLAKIKNELEEQEQYSCRECLRFYVIPETKDENTDNVIIYLVKKHLDISLEPSCISQANQAIKSCRSQDVERTEKSQCMDQNPS